MTDDHPPKGALELAVDLLVRKPGSFVLHLPTAVPRYLSRGRDAVTHPGQTIEQLQAHAHRTLRALGIGTTSDEARGPLPDDGSAAADDTVVVAASDPTAGPAVTDRRAADTSSARTDPTAPAGPGSGGDAGPATSGASATAPAAAPATAPPASTTGELGPAVVAGATVVGGVAIRVAPAPNPEATDGHRAGAGPVGATDTTAAVAAPAGDEIGVDRIDPDGLAIPGYDSLSASQVVPRLESLSAAELDLVRRYELANRGRKTILSKVAQLQA